MRYSLSLELQLQEVTRQGTSWSSNKPFEDSTSVGSLTWIPCHGMRLNQLVTALPPCTLVLYQTLYCMNSCNSTLHQCAPFNSRLAGWDGWSRMQWKSHQRGSGTPSQDAEGRQQMEYTVTQYLTMHGDYLWILQRPTADKPRGAFSRCTLQFPKPNSYDALQGKHHHC